MTPRMPAFEPSTGNVFADLGFDRPDDELVKAQIIFRIVALIDELELTQAAAGALLGLPQPKVALLFQGRTTGFSTHRLIRCLSRLGHDVDIVIRGGNPRRIGRVRVVDASRQARRREI